MFTEPKSSDLSTLLKDLIVPRVDSNPPRRLTLGIKQLHAEIAANKSFSSSNFSFKQRHSDDTGRLLFGESTPLLGKRYRLLETIGEGTFSQIFKASDLQGSRTVAIKVMQIGLDLLGIRESTLLRYFASKTLRGSKHFVEVIETFRFEDHVCVALELCDCTLYNFLRIPTADNDNVIKASNNDLFSREIYINRSMTIHAPKPIRHSVANSVSNDRNILDKEQAYNLDFHKFRKIATSLVSALCIMRKEGAIHADIKPENCFVTWSRGGKKSITTSATPEMNINDLPSDFDIRLGDFGNSLHISEASKYYQDFDIQTLSYRAPEVMFGVPFGPQIDVWSLGILLLELCIRKPLFIVRSREELLKSMEMKLSTPKLLRFAGGMYSDILMNNNESIILPKINFPQHMLSVKRLLSKVLLDVPADLVHFFAGMLHPDPDIRLTALDALQHPFLSSSLPIPMYLLNTKTNQRGAAAVGVAALRSKFSRQSPSVHSSIAKSEPMNKNEKSHQHQLEPNVNEKLMNSDDDTATTPLKATSHNNSVNNNGVNNNSVNNSESNNSVNNSSVSNSVSDVTVRVQTTKKSREIELLQKSNDVYTGFFYGGDEKHDFKKKRL